MQCKQIVLTSQRTKRRFLLKDILIYGILCFASLSVSRGEPIKRIEVPLKAEAFPLAEVRLLNGPFKHAQELDHQYLLQLQADRLLAWYRKEAGLPEKATVYGGWESKGVAGHTLGHYLSACSEMYVATGDKRLRERVDYIVRELALCQQANGNGYVAAIPNGKKVFAELAKGVIKSQGFDLNGAWVPFYTLHKELAGLRDAYRLCGNTNALVVERALADFIGQTLSHLNHDQMQKILACEHGGMNEVLADLYADTGDESYLQLARRFYHEAVLVPLTEHKDILDGLHANTQIPKLIGLADLYELTGDTNDRSAAMFFWDRVVNHHSYVSGGDGLDEHFGPPDKLNNRLGNNTTETCNVYNMLKLTGHVFEWTASAAAADFYERALYNHILASQNSDDGRVIYNLTLAMGGRKHYETPFNSFTCCVGTGMESHARYGAGIYFYSTNSLYVNLFIASTLDWKEQGVYLTQETKFPDAEKSTLIFQCAQPQKFTLNIRRPYWAGDGYAIIVNGKSLDVKGSSPSSYISIKRAWRSGDKVEIHLPRVLHLQAMPDNPDRVAVLYGPLVLAGMLGPENDPNADKSDYVPVMLTDNKPPSDWMLPLTNESCMFQTENVGRPRDVILQPFYRINSGHYTVYWDIFTQEQWRVREAVYEVKQKARQELESRTVDFFQPGEMQPERDHNFTSEKSRFGDAGGHKWRDAIDGGWFSWNMKVLPDQPQALILTYWGGDSGDRIFDILVNGQLLASQTLANNTPGKFFDVTYPLPKDWLKDRKSITIRVQGHPGATAGGIFGARLLQSK
jgi:DUF1680 family protein